MRRILTALILILSGALAASGIWMLSYPAVTPFIVPGATDVQVVTISWGQRQISYRTSGPPDAWYWTVARTLEAQHWTLRNRWRPDESSIYDPVVPLSFERGYAGVVSDEVVLVPDRRDPQRATIMVRRHISIPWWGYWLSAGEGPNQKNLASTCPSWC
jgi:hypothetical protein